MNLLERLDAELTIDLKDVRDSLIIDESLAYYLALVWRKDELLSLADEIKALSSSDLYKSLTLSE